MVRNPFKTLDVLTKSPRSLDKTQARQVLAASALGELMQAPGVPVLCVAAAALFNMAASIPGFTTPDAYERFMVYKCDRLQSNVDDNMRASFEHAWGITVAEQQAIESYYAAFASTSVTMPPIKTPKFRDPEQFDVYDDVLISEIDHRAEDPWWLLESEIGQILLGTRL